VTARGRVEHLQTWKERESRTGGKLIGGEKSRGKKKKKKNRVKKGRMLSTSFLKLLRFMRYEPCHISIYSWDFGAEKEEDNPKIRWN
jgi:hypothetical protein